MIGPPQRNGGRSGAATEEARHNGYNIGREPLHLEHPQSDGQTTDAQRDGKELSIESGQIVPPRVGAGLLLLLESFAYASDVALDPWEFSVEWAELQRFGITANDGRWLIQKGLVQHARETTSPDDAYRSFVPCKGQAICPNTCLVLTEAGCRLARRIAEAQGAVVASPSAQPVPSGSLYGHSLADKRSRLSEHPIWDRCRRELRVNERVVKEFRVPAPNQEMVLDVFQEENWPPRIDDPLPPKPGGDPQRRLHDTINSLNRNQRCHLIRFFADGLGKGVRWEYIDGCDALA